MPRTSSARRRAKEVEAQLASENEDALRADGFEDCLVGICYQFGRPPVACYDYDACVRILMRRDRMTFDQAVEFFEFNVVGAWVGDSTPAFIKLST